jgi:hypothetical protein
VRDDRWKLVYVPTRTGAHWMLFDTVADLGETHDVSSEHPDMTEHGGYLVPRDPRARNGVAEGAGLVRLE